MANEADEDLLLKNFMAEVSEVERDNEVLRSVSNHDNLFKFLPKVCSIFVITRLISLNLYLLHLTEYILS